MSKQDDIHNAIMEMLEKARQSARSTTAEQLQNEHNRVLNKAKERRERLQKAYEFHTWTCKFCQVKHSPSFIKDPHTDRKILVRVKECSCEQAKAVAAQIELDRIENERNIHLSWLIYNEKWLAFDADWTNSGAAKEQLKKAKDAVLRAYVDKRTGILISGPVGVGKSHLARAFYLAYGTQGKRASFYTEPDIVEALRSKSDKDEKAIMSKCRLADVLIFDDIGAEKFNSQSEWVRNLLQSFYFKIFEKRQLSKITFMTTNLKSQEMKQHIGERATSRVMHIVNDASNIIQLWDVPDYRARNF